MAGEKKFTVEQVRDALNKGNGMRSLAAKHLGCDWGTVDNYCQEFPELMQIVTNRGALKVDLAESVIEGKMFSLDEKVALEAAKFILRTKGRDRGWGDHVQVDGKVQINKVEVEVVYKEWNIEATDDPRIREDEQSEYPDRD